MTTSPADLLTEGYRARHEHRPVDAERNFAQAAELSRASGDQKALARSLAGLGQIKRDQDEMFEARRHYEDAVSACRKADDPQLLAHTVRHLADTLRKLGNPLPAEAAYEEALSIYRSHDLTRPLDLANTLRGFALLKSDPAQVAAARKLWQEAKELYATIGGDAGVAESDRQLALLASM